MDINKFIIPGETVGQMNLIFIYVKIFLKLIALLLKLNLDIFIISIIL